MSEFQKLPNLASERLGARVIAANDDFLCAERKSLEGFEADFHRGQIHGPRQMDGRLGNAPPAHSRLRLVHRATGIAGNHSRGRSLIRAIFVEIIPSNARSKPARFRWRPG